MLPSASGQDSPLQGGAWCGSFPLRDSGGRVRRPSAPAIASNWGMSQANQNGDKCSSAAPQAEKQKANHLKGGYGHGGSSCTPPGRPARSITSRKPLYTHTRSVGNEQQQPEIGAAAGPRSQCSDTRGGTARRAAVLSWMATASKAGRGVALCVREQLECVKPCLGVGEE